MTEQLSLFDSRWVRAADAASAPLCMRESRRARNLTLRLIPPHTLELVVPRGTRPAEVAAFVHEHRLWIERARSEIASHYPVEQARLPARIDLPSIGQSWQVRYRHQPGARPQCRCAADVLEATLAAGTRELQLVAAQDAIADPPARFGARRLR